MVPMLEAALEYAKDGIPIFPVIVTPKDMGDKTKFVKAPLVMGGHKSGSIDVNQITEWWTKWPFASIGVRPCDMNAVVVDVDVGANLNNDGTSWLSNLRYTDKITRTISGGEHWWYFTRELFGNSKPDHKIDIRSANGYVILPPSPGYTWLRDGNMTVFPEDYAAQLRKADTAETKPSHDGDDNEVNIARAKKYLQYIGPAIEGYGGDHYTFTVACELVRNIGLSEDMATELMLQYWNERCEPPWSEEELRVKVWNACEYGRGDVGWNYTSGSAIPKWGLLENDFTAGGWLRREIEPKQRLIGPINHDSRILLLAPTGLGKTHFAMGIAGHVANGSNFMHWEVPEAKRVLIIDGEMPLSLLQERLQATHRQLNGAMQWLDKLVLLSMADFFDVGPMDTIGGQQWALSQITEYKPDLVIFDNYQALTAGDMKDTESWRAMLPWVRMISRQEIAQIWVHHTNENGKQYGDKTRSFQLDTEIILSDPEDDIGGTGLAFDLTFGKHRERTPSNAPSYSHGRITLCQDRWNFTQGGDIKAGLVRQALMGQPEAGIKTKELAELVAQITGKSVRAEEEMIRRECRKGNQEMLGLRVPTTIGTANWLWKG